MKLTLIGPVHPYRSGIAYHTGRLAVALRDAGHAVQLISFKRQYPAFLYPGSSDKTTDPNPIKNMPSAAMLLDPVYPWSWQNALKEIGHFGAQRVIVQWWTTAWAAAFGVLLRQLQRRNISTTAIVHNALPHEPRRFDVALARFALSPVGAFVAHNASEAQRLQQDLHLRAPIAVCPLPVFNQLAARRLPKHAARHALGWDAATPTILFFGLVRAYKGLGPLIEAVALLRQQSHALRLAIVGEFWDDPQPYRQRIAALGLDGCVQVINRYVPDADALTLFSAADVFAAPYERGTQSGAVSMALSFGLPVVTTTHIAGGLAPEQQARLCLMSDHSPAAIAQALVQALSANRDAAPTSPNTNANANAEAEAEAAAAWESLVNAIV